MPVTVRAHRLPSPADQQVCHYDRGSYNRLQSCAMATPRSVRFEPHVYDRLTVASQRESVSMSALVNRYVDEAIRMEEHPGVLFRSGPSGRRAVLAGGPDVWEVIRAIKIAREADPSLSPDGLLDAVAEGTGVPRPKIQVAINYWSAYPDEIEDWLANVAEEEAAIKQRMRRERELLAS